MATTKNWKESEVPSAWTTSIDKRKAMHEPNDEDDSDDQETPQPRRYRGWTARGILRYNQLHAEIKVKRELDTFKEFEKYCLEEFQAEAEALGKNNHKRRKREPDKPLPMATHDLWDDEVAEEVQETGVARMLPDGMRGLVGI